MFDNDSCATLVCIVCIVTSMSNLLLATCYLSNRIMCVYIHIYVLLVLFCIEAPHP